MPTVTINGREISLNKPSTILEAALASGIEIPHLCDHPMLEKHGACRICLVSVKGMPRLMPSCTTPVEDSMVVETETPEVARARKAVVELMLVNHPLECPSCDKASNCKLQDYAFRYGAATARFGEDKAVKPSTIQDPLIRQNRGRCILCTRCVRMCEGVQGVGALAPVGRGNKAAIESFAGHTLDCEYCGNCLSACPVGALTAKSHFPGGRPWDTDDKRQSACAFCGLGCEVEVEFGKGRIQKVSPKGGAGILCARGSFGYDVISSPERLRTPLVRKGGQLRESTWEEALGRVAGGLSQIRSAHGGRSIAALASPLCSNEDNYMLQRFMRLALDSPNIDSTARFGLAASRPIVEGLLGPGAGAASISRLECSDAIIVVGGDPTSEMPVLGVKVRQAHKRGVPVVVFGRTPGLARFATYLMEASSGRQWPLLEALTGLIVKRRGLPGTRPVLEAELGQLVLPGLSDLPETHFAEDLECISNMLEDKKAVTLIVGREAAASEHGARNLLVISSLCHVLGAEMVLSSEVINENGLLDMGCLPESLPGGGSTSDSGAWLVMEKALGLPEGFTGSLRDARSEGLSLAEMFQSALAGDLKALFVMGANPAASLPYSSFVREALEEVEFLVVQDIMLTETAKMADVVLPALAWTEREGTYTDASLRLRHMPACLKAEGRPDWRILAELSSLCGLPVKAESAEDVREEIGRAVPAYRDMDKMVSGEAMVLSDRTAAVRLDWLPDCRALPAGSREALYVDPSLFYFGTLGLHSKNLDSIRKAPVLHMNKETAARLGLRRHAKAELSTGQGSIIVEVVITSSLAEGAFALSNADGMTELNELTRFGVARVTRAPYPIFQDLRVTAWEPRRAMQKV